MYKLKTIGFYLILPSYILGMIVLAAFAILVYAYYENKPAV